MARGSQDAVRIGSRRSGRSKRRSAASSYGRDYYDYNLLAAVILLTCFGLVMLYSTSWYSALAMDKSDTYFFARQAGISVIALIAAILGSQVDYHVYTRYSGWLYLGSLGLLVITRFRGNTVNGATRWLEIGPISFQPAEITKLAVILFLPWLIISMGEKIRMKRSFWTVFLVGMLGGVFTYVFTENLSTAVIIAGITVVVLFIVYPNTRRFLTIGGITGVIGIAALVVLVHRIPENSDRFRLRRILVWLNPERYSQEGGYQVMQALYAIGSGGFFGKGLGNSTQKLGTIPEAHNDMIFSIICEELGLFGALVVVTLFVFLLYRLYYIARNAPDLLGSLIATGIFAHIALQVVLNIAVVINMIPTTGITLPFISYGGTSILFLMAEMTVALSISRQINVRH